MLTQGQTVTLYHDAITCTVRRGCGELIERVHPDVEDADVEYWRVKIENRIEEHWVNVKEH